MSTMASSPKGLNNARYCSRPRHRRAGGEVPVGDRRRGRTARPRSRRRARSWCDTAAGPPMVSTTTPGSGVARMSATLTRVSSPGARRRCRDRGAPSPPGITVMVASTVDGARLATMTVSSARPSGVDVPSAQYHALDATSGDGTLTPVPRRAATRSPTPAVESLEDAPCCTTTAATTAASDDEEDRTAAHLAGAAGAGGRGRGRSHPLPPERVLVEEVVERVRPTLAALAPGAHARSPARPGRAARGCDASATPRRARARARRRAAPSAATARRR